ncbi:MULTISPECIES: GNAT family N-acetyltransferase [Aerosakkonema]|uniref:GNAT family N-acetyltransferase n=1 Tax=Aerosakkonema TaxID=1246629 RepID=UPI0035BB11F9
MTSKIEFGTVSNPEEAQSLGEMLCQCFNFPIADWPEYRDRIGLDNFRVVRQASEIVGGLAIYRMGQWFGQKSVPMAGIAAVGVPPEHRGKKVAIELLSNTIRELYHKGVPISTLYPATQRLYRQMGYEQGGSRCCWELPTESIKSIDRTLSVQKIKTIQSETLAKIYDRQAQQINGNLDRNPAIWRGIVEHKENVVYAYLIGAETQPEGYIIFSQKNEGNNLYLEIWDWVALTPAAIEGLWTFIADHRSQVKNVRWYSGAIDPRLLLLPEQTAKIRFQEIWFLRIINVEKALNLRGYPPEVEAELHLAVKDTWIPDNNGNFILTVSGGKAEVTKGGRGDLQLEIRSLAPLYTGLFTPLQLQMAGQLEATDKAILIATQMFAGSHPWMPDFF